MLLNLKFISISLTVAVLVSLSSVAPVGAQAVKDIGNKSQDTLNSNSAVNKEDGDSFSGTDSTSTDTNAQSLNEWLQKAIDLLSGVTVLVIVLSIIISGIQYLTARDNASQVAAAKKRIGMAVLSFILFAFAYGILQWLVPGGIFN